MIFRLVNSMRVAAFLSLTLLAAALLFPAIAADVNEPITLEIPQLQLQLEPNSAAVITSTNFDELLIHVAKSPTQVSPGTLYAKINTQAANMKSYPLHYANSKLIVSLLNDMLFGRGGGGGSLDEIRNEVLALSEWTNRDFLGGMRKLTAHAEAGWAFIPNFYAVSTNDVTSPSRNGPIAKTSLQFEQPRFLDRPSLREQSKLEVERTLEQTYNAISARLTNGVIWQPRSRLSIFPSYHLEADYLNGPPVSSAATAPLTLGCDTTSDHCLVWLSYLEEVLTWDRRDHPLEPRNGFYASLSLQEGGGPLRGNFSYFRVLPDLRGYISAGEVAGARESR